MIRRATAVLAACLITSVATAPAAWAHGDTTEPSATNYVSHITGLTTPIPGVTVRMVDASTNIELRNDGPDDVIVLGYDGETYLRIGPAGAFVNARSPTPSMNDPSALASTPTTQVPTADPIWRPMGPQPVARWHDHRTHWMGSDAPPSGDQSMARVVTPYWTLPLEVGGQHVDVTGDVEWLPPPSALPFLVLAAAIALLLLVVAMVDEVVGPLAIGGLTIVVGVVECVAVLGSPEATASVELIVFGPVAIAAVGGGGWFLAHDDRRSGRLLIVVAAVVVGTLAGFMKVPYLNANEVPSPLPGWLARADVAVAMGVGAAAGLVVLWWALRTLSTSARSARVRPHPVGS
jgi:hypothetical protein